MTGVDELRVSGALAICGVALLDSESAGPRFQKSLSNSGVRHKANQSALSRGKQGPSTSWKKCVILG